MKKLFLAAMVLCAATLVNAQDDSKAAPKPTATPAVSPNAADISFENETHDFGTIPYNGNGTL
jgi:hypothetical protein